MPRILFMPLLRLPSGHHHAADSLKHQLEETGKEFICEKAELISHSYGRAESVVSAVYLQWIHRLPKLYSMVYKFGALKQQSQHKRYYLYEWLFQKKIQQLIQEKGPDVVICTHALPSYLLSQLKSSGKWKGKVINVYTDFFINNLWGINGIDYHFVPSLHVKQDLLKKGVPAEHVIVSGIPIHPLFQRDPIRPVSPSEKYTIIISGGNMGAGSIKELLLQLRPGGRVHYKVLCGKNTRLHQSLRSSVYTNVSPIPYISSKKEMNELYNEADALITKPGGITITECLWKRIPTFVYEALPGQEEVNLTYLKDQGLVHHLPYWKSNTANLEDIILEVLQDEDRLSRWQGQMEIFHQGLEERDVTSYIKGICQDV
ncbi:MGDG synthase family glycosyltransferase [Virgibacillus sediminis]|uniref:Glycosyltransferase n=1 Tax=Virgibacillus sediminis TaxID=202260 RepID=A0ABV7A428_9BACI